MEAVSISSSLLPLSNASLQNNSRSRTTSLMLSSHLKLRTHPSLAAADVLHSTAAAAAASGSPGSGGDIAVLLPVGGVLFFAYWIANFVLPWFISKDFAQPEASGREEKEEEED